MRARATQNRVCANSWKQTKKAERRIVCACTSEVVYLTARMQIESIYFENYFTSVTVIYILLIFLSRPIFAIFTFYRIESTCSSVPRDILRRGAKRSILIDAVDNLFDETVKSREVRIIKSIRCGSKRHHIIDIRTKNKNNLVSEFLRLRFHTTRTDINIYSTVESNKKNSLRECRVENNSKNQRKESHLVFDCCLHSHYTSTCLAWNFALIAQRQPLACLSEILWWMCVGCSAVDATQLHNDVVWATPKCQKTKNPQSNK